MESNLSRTAIFYRLLILPKDLGGKQCLRLHLFKSFLFFPICRISFPNSGNQVSLVIMLDGGWDSLNYYIDVV